MQKIRYFFTESKFGKFWIKAHLQYLVLALAMYGLKAVLYFIIAYIPCNPVTFGNPTIPYENGPYAMAIDNAIPLVSYFYFFYVLYYVVPEIMLWILSFFDKKKVVTIVVACASATVLACICYLIQQVKMIRPEALVGQYADFSKVHDLNTFFLWAINKQYIADETALNCFPSLHSTVGMALSLCGIWTGKDEKHFPIGLRIFCGLFGAGIMMSTFFVKQHYFIDTIVGAGLMAVLYFVYKLFIVPPFLRRREAKLSAQETATEN